MLFGADDAGDPTDLLLVPEGMEGAAVLPRTLATVPACVFSRCTKLSAIIIPGSTVSAHLTSANGILYSENLTAEGEPDGTLTLVAVPAGLGASASIAAGCTAIGEGAFWGNDGLKTIIAPAGIADIAAGSAHMESGAGADDATDADTPVPAFNQATIENATVLTTERAPWEAAGFTNFAKPAEPGEVLAPAPGDSGLTYTLMDNGQLSVKWTGDAPASGKRNIPSAATLHGVDYTVSVIEDGAFAGQTELTEIVLPDTITTIGASAFDGCSALAQANIPASTATIDHRAFAATALQAITLPTSVATVGEEAFAENPTLFTLVALGDVRDVAASALAGTAGVSVYVPYHEDGAYAWSIGAPASGNHLMPYGVKASPQTIELRVDEQADLFAGGYLEAPGRIEVATSYRSCVSITDNRTVIAKQIGTTPAITTLTLDGRILAAATGNITVLPAEKPEAPAEEGTEEGGGLEGETVIGETPIINQTFSLVFSEKDEISERAASNISSRTSSLKDPGSSANPGIQLSFNAGSYTSAHNNQTSYAHFWVTRYTDAGVNPPQGGERVSIDNREYTVFNVAAVYTADPASDSGFNVHSYKNYDQIGNLRDYVVAPYMFGYKATQLRLSNGMTYAENSGNGIQITGALTGVFDWYPKTYTVTYAGIEGATLSSGVGRSTYQTDQSWVAPYYTKDGYSFEGWKVSGLRDADNNEVVHDTGSFTKEYNQWGNLTLTAQWKPRPYTVTLNTDGGSISNSSWTESTANSKYTRSYNVESSTFSLPTPKREGYTFNGWKPNNTGTVDKNISITKGTTGNKSYTASWTKKTYTLVYKAGAGSGTDVTQPAAYGESVTLKGANTFTPETGHHLSIWNCQANKIGYAPGYTFKSFPDFSTTTIVFDAGYAENRYSITYSLGNGTGTVPSAHYNINYSEKITLASSSGITAPKGHYFSGWKCSSNNVVYSAGGTVSKLTTELNATVTMTAQFTANRYTVILDPTGGTQEKPSWAGSAADGNVAVTGTYNQYLPTGDSPTTHIKAPTRIGYTFLGYYTSETGGDKYYGVNASDNTYMTAEKAWVIANDTTLYARWTPNKSTVLLDPQGGVQPSSPLFAYDADVKLYSLEATYDSTLRDVYTRPDGRTQPISCPSKTGYVFDGYYTGKNGAGTKFYEWRFDSTDLKYYLKATSNKWNQTGSRVTLYANWVPNVYKITLTPATDSVTPTSSGTTALYLKYGVGWYTSGRTGTTGGKNTAECAGSVSGNAVSSITKPTAAGWTFGGYPDLIDSAGTITAKNNAFSTSTSKSATWTARTDTAYTIQYYYQSKASGTWPAAPTKTIPGKGTTATTKTLTAAEKTPSTANGQPALGTGERYVLDAGHAGEKLSGVIAGDGSLVLKVFFRVQFQVSYTTSSANKGTVGSGGGWRDYDAQVGSAATATAKTGYKFTGWSPVHKATDKVKQALTYVAQWTASKYLITLSTEGGVISSSGWTEEAANATYTKEYTIESSDISVPQPTRTAYTFTGWKKDDTGVPQVDMTIPSGSTGPRDFTASWRDNIYTIAFDRNQPPNASTRVEGNMADQTMTCNERKRVSANRYYITGYRFKGWATDPDSTTVKVGDMWEIDTNSLCTEDGATVTLYAIWEAKEFNLIFDANKGSYPDDEVTPMPETANVIFDRPYGLPLTVPQRAGYNADPAVFSWNTMPDGTGTFYKPGDIYTVRYHENLGTHPGDKVYGMPDLASFAIDYRASTDLQRCEPARVGYEFGGWALEAGSTEAFAQPGDAYIHLVAGDVDLYAIWNPIEGGNGFRFHFYKFTDKEHDKSLCEFTSAFTGPIDFELAGEPTPIELPGDRTLRTDKNRVDVPGYFLYGWTWVSDWSGIPEGERSRYILPTDTDMREIVIDKLGITDPALRDIELFAVWQVAYHFDVPSDAAIASLVLDASEKETWRASDVALSSTTPCPITVEAWSEAQSIASEVFPRTDLSQIDFLYDIGEGRDNPQLPLDGSSRRVQQIGTVPAGATGAASQLAGQLSIVVRDKSQVNISQKVTSDDAGMVMNGTVWDEPLARIHWLLSMDPADALTHTLLAAPPTASGDESDLPGFGEVEVAATPSARPDDPGE